MKTRFSGDTNPTTNVREKERKRQRAVFDYFDG